MRFGLFSAVASVLVFVWLCGVVLELGTLQFDLHLRTWIHSLASPWLTSIFLFITQVGSWFVLLSAAVLLAILFLNSSFAEARLLMIAMYGAVVLASALKIAFHRARPEPFFGLAVPTTHSFPSAHALVSFCFFSLIAGIISRHTRHRSFRWCAWGLAGSLITVIGLSRVYLGVQYPSSVLAGYAAGVVWMEVVKFLAGPPDNQTSTRTENRALGKS
jgi:undecaprenyl-diphosphatase